MPISPPNFRPNKAKDKFHDWPVMPYPKDMVRRDLDMRNETFVNAFKVKIPGPKFNKKRAGLKATDLGREIFTFCQGMGRPVGTKELYRQFEKNGITEQQISNRLTVLVRNGYLWRPVQGFYEVIKKTK